MGLFCTFLERLDAFNQKRFNPLLLFRFIQALGGSTGSVLGMSILRDSWPEKALGSAFSKMSVVLAFALGVGPIFGGFLTHYAGWKSNFQFLLIFGCFVLGVVMIFLPETRAEKRSGNFQGREFFSSMKEIFLDRKVLTFGILIGGCNGILFSYFAEGPFLFIVILKQDPSIYGILTFLVAVPWALGGMISNRLCKIGIEGEKIILLGSVVNLMGCALFWGLTWAGFVTVSSGFMGVLSVALPLMFALAGIGMMIPNCLSQALKNYKDRSGSAASIFGFFYYLVIAALTYVMGTIHDGTVYPMPIFFVVISGGMLLIYTHFLQKQKKSLAAG